MTLRFGTDGVRGSTLTEITPQFVFSLGRAASGVLHSDRWIVGRDTRESGAELSAAFAAGLGANVYDLGVMPTPAVAYWSQRLDLPAAVVTASHNPWSDNGVKIFAAGGTKLLDDVERAIEAALPRHADVALLNPEVHAGTQPFELAIAGAVDLYVDHVNEGIGHMAGGASLAPLRVVLDCANGAMSHVAPAAFARLGAQVTTIHHTPNGRNINDHCGATSLGSLVTAVVQRGADLGLAFDGDGDRVIAVDHLGNIVDGDHLLALAALQLRDAGELVDQTVVVTVMSNLGFHRAMARGGITVVTTAVGDRSVLEALDSGGYSLGGEQSGHVIYRHLATTGDGLLAGLRLTHNLVARESSLPIWRVTP